jgi:adenine deaminase
MAVARGEKPADLVVTGGKVLSVFTKEWLEVDVAIVDGHVVGLGRYDGAERMDVAGAYLVPGFIDAHMHIESSKLTVDEFARAVLAHVHDRRHRELAAPASHYRRGRDDELSGRHRGH